VRKILDMVHVCAKFHENRKGSGFFFVDLAWNDPCVILLLLHVGYCCCCMRDIVLLCVATMAPR